MKTCAVETGAVQMETEAASRWRRGELTDGCASSAGAVRAVLAATSSTGSAGTMSSVMPSNVLPGFLTPNSLRALRVVGRRRGAVALCRTLFLTLAGLHYRLEEQGLATDDGRRNMTQG